MGRADFSNQFRIIIIIIIIIICHKYIGYNLNVMRQSACSETEGEIGNVNMFSPTPVIQY